jgi:NADH:ubiquinone oxidoreductase subunit 5 (subunit L)/multisubunit Na+/H+ antiporter MnhA subunit/multisubunit Na+/H+ antiporter MnhB subunit
MGRVTLRRSTYQLHITTLERFGMEIAAIAGIPFLLAVLIAGIRKQTTAAIQGGLLAVVLAGLCAFALTRLPSVTAGAMTYTLDWVPQLGLALSFYLDGLALLFVVLISGVGAVIVLYAGFYFEDGAESGRFLALLMAFTGAMLGLVTAGNVLTLFIAWELTSIISFLLIGFYGDEKARKGSLQALLVTGGGGLALLVGLLLLAGAAGSSEMAVILTSGDLLREHPWYSAIAVLIFIGCFSKSAQWPLHFWLPGAMTAPTPASAFLHSATMVKAGIYLLARLQPSLGETTLWQGALVGFGLITLLIGAALALRQTDLKGCLAYSTVSQLGALVALIGLPGGEGIKAAMVGILAHALYKGALFLTVGAVDHAAGTRDLTKLGGLRASMPAFALVALISALSMAGVPPLFGFVGKELLIEASLKSLPMLVTLAVVIVSAALTVAMGFILFWDVFMGKTPQSDHDDHDAHHFHAPNRWMAAGPLGMAALSIGLGLGIGPLVTPLVEPAVGKAISLYLFPPGGINQAFILSMIALAGGAAVFATRAYWRPLSLPTLPTGAAIYQGLVSGVEWSADQLLKSQNGRIRHYLIVILLAVVALMSVAGLQNAVDFSRLNLEITGAADVLKIVLILLSLGATLTSILFRKHLLAALALGVAGYSIGGLFLLEPAPDVALVQFLVETIATVLIIMILVRTSEAERAEAMANLWQGSRASLWRDILIAGVVGVGVTLFALAAVASRADSQTVATWHLENALPQTSVNDVVASIVTDFRGMDTLIEISVFGMAALGVLTLLAGKRSTEAKAPEPTEADAPTYNFAFSDALNRMAARIVLPVALLIAVAHILYAGAAPGDGFTAGVIAGLGIALWYIVFGYEGVRERLRWLHPAPMIGAGLTLALVNAALPLLFGREFFAFTLLPVDLPASIKLASTTIFEIAIFATVFGGISAIMEALTHPKEVETL